jgi:hypothetical protein
VARRKSGSGLSGNILEEWTFDLLTNEELIVVLYGW